MGSPVVSFRLWTQCSQLCSSELPMLPQRLDTVVAMDMVAMGDMVAMAEDTMGKDPLKLMLSQDTFQGDMDTEDMVAMEAMVVMDTTERGKQMLLLKLMPSQDTSPEDMVDMVMEAMEAMAVMDTMERGRPKPSHYIIIVNLVLASAVDMAT